MVANLKNPLALKLARIGNDEYAAMPELFGPEALNLRAMVNPDAEVANAIERMISLPAAVDYGEFGDGRIKVVAIEVRAGPLVGSPLSRFPEIVRDRGLRVGGILRGEKLLLPSARDEIREGDVVYFVCLEESLASVLAITGSDAKPLGRIAIIGGGGLGLKLAGRLERRDLQVKLVEIDPVRAEFLAERLSRTTVLAGDGADRRFMREENLGALDMAVALTGSEPTNILISLLAGSLGCRHTVTRINSNAYLPIVRAIGLSLCVNPRLAAANQVVRLLRRGLRLSSLATQDEEMEMLEGTARPDSPALNRPLRELAFPGGINLLAVTREGEAFIPGGDARLLAGDCLLLLCERLRLDWIRANLIGGQR
jgi:trk system potassium uptake protein TrkA